MSLFWVIFFTFLGAAVYSRTDTGRRLDLTQKLAFSFDVLLPIIQLDKSHYDISISDFGSWKTYYFYLHKIMGYALASFVIAGLSGIVKT